VLGVATTETEALDEAEAAIIGASEFTGLITVNGFVTAELGTSELETAELTELPDVLVSQTSANSCV
jgi:hypothetical protein